MAGVIALKKYLQNGFIIVANGYSKEIKVKVTSQLGERIIQNFKIEFGPTKIGNFIVHFVLLDVVRQVAC